MLPYFNYEVPEENMEGELFARPEEFLDQTKGALEYYSKLFEHNKIFDQVYLADGILYPNFRILKWVEIYKTTTTIPRNFCSFGCT